MNLSLPKVTMDIETSVNIVNLLTVDYMSAICFSAMFLDNNPDPQNIPYFEIIIIHLLEDISPKREWIDSVKTS